MSKVNDMKLKDILKITNIILEKNDIMYFCNNDEVIKKFTKLYWNPNKKSSDIMKFLLDNEKYIDKEAFVLFMARNYEESLKIIDDKIECITEELKYNNSPEVLKMLIKLERERKIQTEILKATKGIGKNMKKIISLYCYNETKNRYCIDIVDSKKVFQGKDVNKNLKRLNEIDKSFKRKCDNHENGIEFVLMSLKPEDVYKTFVDEDLIQMIIVMIQENEILRKGIKTNNELITLKHNNREQYFELVNSINNDNYIYDLKNALKEFSAYLDIDKLLLISAYRYNEILDAKKEKTDPEYYKSAKEILTEIRKHIVDDKVRISCELNHKEGNGYVKRKVNYSVGDLEDCIERLIGDTYISKEEINDKREKLLTDKIGIHSIDSQVLELMKLTKEEINTIMAYNLENFIYGAKKFNYNINQILSKLSKNERIPLNEAIKCLYEENIISISSIIDLYAKGIISRKFFEEFSEEINISSEINIQKINKQYIEMKSSQQLKEKNKNNLESMIDIYRIINIEDKSQEEKEEISNEIMYEIAENFNDENDILFYYNKGLLTLNTVADWSGDELIEKLYNESKITLQDLEILYKNNKVSQQLIEKIILSQKNIDESDLMRYIYLGYMSDENIINIFIQNNIKPEVAQELLKNRLISQYVYNEIKREKWNEITMEHGDTYMNEMEVDISFSNFTKSELREKRKKGNSHNGYPTGGTKINKAILPEARYDFLRLLKCRVPKNSNYEEMEENNPFYNYNFYIIQEDALGDKAQRDAVIIAERFYEDRENKTGISVGNATYIMRYEDYLILSDSQKSSETKAKREMIKEIEGAIYIANHRSGSWASSMLYKIAQAKAGKSFNQYTGDDKRRQVIDWLRTLYTEEELDEILDLGIEIDQEDYTYEFKNGVLVKNINGADMSDTDEERII